MPAVVCRPTRSTKFKDLTGTTTIHGIAVKDHAGFAGKYAIWNCTCPICGADFRMRANCTHKQRSCGCIRRAERSSPQKKRIRQYHYATLRSHCDPVWQDFDRFWQDIGSQLREHERVYRLDDDSPVGPDNFIVCDQRSVGPCGPSARLIFAADHFWSIRRAAEILKTTKQNIHQRISTPGGRERVSEAITVAVRSGGISPRSAAAD